MFLSFVIFLKGRIERRDDRLLFHINVIIRISSFFLRGKRNEKRRSRRRGGVKKKEEEEVNDLTLSS